MTKTDYYVRPIEEQDIPFLWEMLYTSLHREKVMHLFQSKVFILPDCPNTLKNGEEKGISGMLQLTSKARD